MRQRFVTVYHSTHMGSPHTFAVVQRPCRRRREATHSSFLMTFSYITFFSIPFFSIPFYCKRKSVDALFLSCIISWEQLTLTLVVQTCCGCPPYCVVSDKWRRLSLSLQENEIKTSAEKFVIKSEFQTFTDCRSLYRLAVSWWWCFLQWGFAVNSKPCSGIQTLCSLIILK